MRKKIKQYSLMLSGIFFVALGAIGVVLPILPTTPFLILALACFAKSSPRFHQALLNNQFFGDALSQWEEQRSISRRSKIKAVTLIVLSFSLSIYILQGRLPLQLGLASLAFILLAFIWRIKEASNKAVKVS